MQKEGTPGRGKKVRVILRKGSMRGVERKEETLAAAVGAFMHLTGVYTPALHMSSFLSFKSSLQEDRTQRHKHKMVKEPQTQSEWTQVSFNAPSSPHSLTDPDLIKELVWPTGASSAESWSEISSRTQLSTFSTLNFQTVSSPTTVSGL